MSGILGSSFASNWGLPPYPAAAGMTVGSPMSALNFAPVDTSVLAQGTPMNLGGTGAGFGSGLGLNMDTAKLGLAGLGTIGNLWGAFQAASLAKKQFNYTKDITETNLANSLKTYNTQLTDRANNRAIVEGRTPAETQSYIDANKLARYGR